MFIFKKPTRLHSPAAPIRRDEVEKVNESSDLRIRLDSGRAIAFNIRENPHLDYGYALTSHSSQGQTADRVLIHVDTEQAGEKARQSSLGLRRGVAWPLPCANLHQR